MRKTLKVAHSSRERNSQEGIAPQADRSSVGGDRLNTLETRFDNLEKKFDELFIYLKDGFQNINQKFNNMDIKFDKKIKKIDDSLTKLTGFQNYEADAIELELQMILRKHLKKENQNMNIYDFPIKTFYDPYTGKPITQLDGAFLLKPAIPVIDTSRFKNEGIPIPLKENIPDYYIFVLAEAKHHINKNKISIKLYQFDRIIKLFDLTTTLLNSDKINIDKYDSHFITSLKHNKYFEYIHKCQLVFGAAYWEKGLLEKLQSAVKNYKKLLNNFRSSSSNNEKVRIYHDILNLEEYWYPEGKSLHLELSDRDIILLPDIHGAMEYVDIIYPSGDRFAIHIPEQPIGISVIPLSGGKITKINKTRKTRDAQQQKHQQQKQKQDQQEQKE